MDWLECMEREFFTDDLDRRLIEFLGDMDILNSENDSDKWDNLFKLAREWREEYMQISKRLALSSFFAWNIYMTLAVFSLSDNADTAAMMKKILLSGWLLDIDGDAQERECCRSGRFDFEFQCTFKYPGKKCAKLSKSQLVEELREVYDRSYDQFLYHKKTNGNPKYTAWVEPSYPVFMRCIGEFESMDGLQAVRLNEFECDQCVWYFIKDGAKIYFLQISDFA